MLKVRQSLPLPSSLPSSQTLNALSAAMRNSARTIGLVFGTSKGCHSRTVCLLNVTLSQIQQPSPLVTSGWGFVTYKTVGELLATGDALAPTCTRAKDKAKQSSKNGVCWKIFPGTPEGLGRGKFTGMQT